MTVTYPPYGYYCTRCGLWVNGTSAHICNAPPVYPSTSTNTVSWYPDNRVLTAKLDEILETLKKLMESTTVEATLSRWDEFVVHLDPETGRVIKSETTPQPTTTNHKYPIGEKVRLVNGNTKGQWGTIVQHLLNGQYLIANTWLDEKAEPNQSTYQVLNEELIRPLAALLTCADLKVGDKVNYLPGIPHRYRAVAGAFTVTAVGVTTVLLSGTDWNNKEVEFHQYPEDLEIVLDEDTKP